MVKLAILLIFLLLIMFIISTIILNDIFMLIKYKYSA